MNKIVIFILGLILGIMVMRFIYNPKPTSKKIINHTDTIKVEKIKVIDSYDDKLNPSIVEISDSIPSSGQIKIIRDTIQYLCRDTIIIYSPRFLDLYPESDKLIQLLISQNELKLNLLNNRGINYSKSYPLDLTSYQYNYYQNDMTYKKISFRNKINPYTEFTYRPFHNFLDIDLGIKYNTSKVNYKAGVNFYYYNSLSSIGADLFIKFSYQF